jgi:hypothetical protein
MDQMILSEPSIIIIWTYQDMMGWMSRILVGEMALLMRILAWKLRANVADIFFFNPERLIQLSIIHMDQMILSEPSIIIIWTYQDMISWICRILVGEMAGLNDGFGWLAG